MNFEQYQYTIAGFRALEVYPFTKRTKQYFRGYRQNDTDNIYRIVVYPYHLVSVEPLITSLKQLKNLDNPILGKIVHLYEEASLAKVGEKPQQKKVIAVVMEQKLESNFINFYDFIVQMGHISQKLAKDILFSLVHLIKTMNAQGFVNCFNSNDVLFQKNTGAIKIDNYGDSRYFNVHQDQSTDIWELGNLLFTLLKGNPPYNKKTQSDTHYNLLNKGQFQKFWGLVPSKPINNPIDHAKNILNMCFEKQTKIETIQQSQWFRDYQALTQQERKNQIASILVRKQQKMNQKIIEQRERKQRMVQAARERACLINKRGSYSAPIEAFLDYLHAEQQKIKPLCKKFSFTEEQEQSIKLQVLYLMSLLALNENKHVKIYDISTDKDIITLKIKTEIDDNIFINSEVQLTVQKQQNKVKLTCKRIHSQNLFESMWVNNYIKELVGQA